MNVNVKSHGSEPTAKLATWCCAPVDTEALRDDQASALADVFAALADPVRLRIFSLIASQGEVCSCNLEAPLQRSQPTISHHTSRLAAAGLIVGEKRGRWTWWRPVAGQVDEVARVLRVTPSTGDADTLA
ncbi:MAG: helix-turn-helix transcriptional regulator [Acidobacteriota bacterium]|nr:helix-turn-helix transcriptional regulator [Acidobacteriota bacterium]MDE3044526.1 helix-turn-helix transcriptional regulator [Acidobacteriota bacterium]MDE3221949.1 helix-turn-helix transcriptional regulator [Acidobacteriota bacterium]